MYMGTKTLVPQVCWCFLLIKVRALIKPENIESTEIHWKPVRIVRLSDPLQKRAVLKWHQKKTPKKGWGTRVMVPRHQSSGAPSKI